MTTSTALLEQSTGITNPLLLLQGMIDKGADPDALKKLMDLAERWQQNQAVKAFAQAMNAAQQEMPVVVRDATNPHTRSKYAKLETVAAKMRPIYTKHGFSLSYSEEPNAPEGMARVCLEVQHIAGHAKRHILDITIDGKGAKGGDVMNPTQGKGSTLSYAKRYLALMAFNITIADEDNDAAGQCVSADQVAQMNDLIVAKGVDLKRFLDWAECEGLDTMPVKTFAKAMDFLKRKKVKA